MSQNTRVAKRLAKHGSNVFVYRQIFTNQVIYSLDRSMNVRPGNPPFGDENIH